MAYFRYRAYDATNGTTSGQLEAPDRNTALRQLKQQGVRLLQLEEFSHTDNKSSNQQSTTKTTSRQLELKLKSKELHWFTEELADMLEAGIQLETALKALSERKTKGNLRFVSEKIRASLVEGAAFSSALRLASPSFSSLYCSLCAAGEASGSLHLVLRKQAEHIKAMAELKSKIVTALTYPFFLFVVGIVVILLFVTYLVPMLSELLSEGGAIPPGAAALMSLSNFIRVGLPWAILVLLVSVGALLLWRKKPDNKRQWDRTLLHMPLLGTLNRLYFAAGLAQTLATVINGGLPLLRGLQLTQGTTANLWYQQRLDLACQRVAEGADLSQSLRDTEEVPPLLLDMIRLGERTGNLPESLQRAGERFEKDLANKISVITALIGPIMVLSISIPIAAVAYLIVTAIFDTMSTIN